MASKEKQSEYNRRYYWDNVEEQRQRSREYYHENKDKIDKEERKKYLSEYYQNNKAKYKRKPEHIAGINARKRERYAQNPEIQQYYRENAKRWQQENPHKRKAQRIKKYKLTLEEFNALLEAQKFSCAICGYSDMSNPRYFPFVDHCHDTGRVRGLLCANCNHAIGKLKDNPALFRRAAEYLEEDRG